MTGVESGPGSVSRPAIQRASAACGIVAPFLSAVVAAGVGYLHPGYDFTEQRLSELGASGAPYAALFNVMGLMASGVLVVVFSLGLYLEFSERLARIGSGLLAVCGACLFMAGIFPCDVEFAEASVSGIMHGVFAGIGTFAIIGAALAMWLGLKRDTVWRDISRFSLGVAVVAVALYLPYQVFPVTGWIGVFQRMLVLVVLVWLEVMSIKLLYRSWARASVRE